MKLHYNWRYKFLRVSVTEVVKRYLQKYHSSKAKSAAAKAKASSACADEVAAIPGAPEA